MVDKLILSHLNFFFFFLPPDKFCVLCVGFVIYLFIFFILIRLDSHRKIVARAVGDQL